MRPSPEQPIRELSGGNQQKVLLARWLCMNPTLLILDEPTRGIDVGAKAEILKLMRELADEGLSVLMISSELEELIAAADHVTVLRDGRSVAELDADELSEERLMAAMAHQDEAAGMTDARSTSDAGAARARARDVAASGSAATARSPRSWLLIVFNIAVTPNFLSWQTLNVNLTQVATIVIVAVGMTLVIATGGIDLSVGSLMAISGALAPMIFLGTIVPIDSRCSRSRWPSSCRSSSPALLGWFNGMLITRYSIQPIVATLVLFIAGRGIAQVMTNGNLQVFKNERVPVHRARPGLRHPGAGRSSWSIVVAARGVPHPPHRASAARSSPSAATRRRRGSPAFRPSASSGWSMSSAARWPASPG